jgi:hypothetical protein
MKSIFKGVIELNEDKKGLYSFNLKDLRYTFFLKFISRYVKVKMERNTKIVFEATNIETLKDYLSREKTLSYYYCKSLFVDIGNQIKELEKKSFGYLDVDIEDIIIIETDDKKVSMIFLNIDKHFEVKKNIIEINKLFKKNLFISPEIKNINQIPTQIIYKQHIFYSLAKLICFCINNINKNNFEEYKKALDIILETKLYWALLRCLKDIPENRYYLLI